MASDPSKSIAGPLSAVLASQLDVVNTDETMSKDETWPSLPMMIPVASVGTSNGGSSGRPALVTTRPWASSLSAPLRVKPMVPSALTTGRKPGPSIAMSRGLPVCSMLP